MVLIFSLLFWLIDLYTYIIFASVIISWLLAFGILKMSNNIIYRIVMVITGLTQPIFDVVRAVVPSLFGLDFSPVIILLALQGIKIALIQLAISMMY
ncbi:MAG: YggT family protein [Alphaproteobacteria bacterium]|nr:YggT family protein [Alphaproteobacteria bacterium]